MKKIIVIGGGAAGMLAAIAAAEAGADVLLLEKNEKLGKKIYITGKGRCNVTNACDTEDLLKNVVTNRRFLYSALYAFTNLQTMEFFEECGVPLKVERGERVFPVSDKSSDVINGLVKRLKQAGVTIKLNTTVNKVCVEGGSVTGVELQSGERLSGDACIVATGGLSYASTGSTGDGYTFAKLCGHTVTDCYPSLVGLKITEPFAKELEGLSLKNVTLKAVQGKKVLYDGFGELLFTADGISGPLVLSASAAVTDKLQQGEVRVLLDLKPALSKEELDARILRDFEEAKNKQFRNALDKLLPQRLIRVIIGLCGIPEEKQVNSVTKQERAVLVDVLKGIELHIKKTGGFNEAVITRGGISVKEVNPSTMESKLTKGLYFAGEVLDVDALTGGYNLQIAWSTGYLAGGCAAEEV
ncbi:MAG: NAD(P)/FAD-dependent oxidoreductase [Lachnospiraceae bacterium]|nr:NAD(P)/FAD-dependent oxidoreductase [Lachnospiraceae bacterium]MBQ8548854.1 NAD(P)/FAD-dependent oxidoreductase [Lachnospiraceae bacterium]